MHVLIVVLALMLVQLVQSIQENKVAITLTTHGHQLFAAGGFFELRTIKLCFLRFSKYEI